MRLPNSHLAVPAVAAPEPVPLKATYLNRRAFLALSQVGSETCTLQVAQAPELPAGTPVQLRIEIQDQVMAFQLEGRVVRAVAGRAQVAFEGAAVQSFGRVYAFARGAPLGWGRRANERVSASFPIHVYTADGQLARGDAEDASRGGLRVRLSAIHLRPDQALRFVARLGLLRRIRGTARVAWARPDRGQVVAGLQFQEMVAADRLTLGAYLLERRRTP